VLNEVNAEMPELVRRKAAQASAPLAVWFDGGVLALSAYRCQDSAVLPVASACAGHLLMKVQMVAEPRGELTYEP